MIVSLKRHIRRFATGEAMTGSSHIRRGRPIEPSLGWTYLSRDALARAKAQMDEESMGVRDEIGFLTIHQGYADRFFPGTSVLHTRARYALFVPWLFQDMAGLTGPAATRTLREHERVLAGRLRDMGEAQVIAGLRAPPCAGRSSSGKVLQRRRSPQQRLTNTGSLLTRKTSVQLE